MTVLVNSRYRVILRSLRSLGYSTVHVTGNRRANQGVNSPVASLTLHVLRSVAKTSDDISGYCFAHTGDNMLVGSLAVTVHGHRRHMVNLLYVGVGLSIPFSRVVDAFIPPRAPSINSDIGFTSSIRSLIARALRFAVRRIGTSHGISGGTGGHRVILGLCRGKVFSVGSTVGRITSHLGVSGRAICLCVHRFGDNSFRKRSGWYILPS